VVQLQKVCHIEPDNYPLVTADVWFCRIDRA